MTKEIKVGDKFSFTKEQLDYAVSSGEVSGTDITVGKTYTVEYVKASIESFDFRDDQMTLRCWDFKFFPCKEDQKWKVGDTFTIDTTKALEGGWYIASDITDTTVLRVVDMGHSGVGYNDIKGNYDSIGFECMVPYEELEVTQPDSLEALKTQLNEFVSIVKTQMPTEVIKSVVELLEAITDDVKQEVVNRSQLEEKENLLNVIVGLQIAKGRKEFTVGEESYHLFADCEFDDVGVWKTDSLPVSPFGIYFNTEQDALDALATVGKDNYIRAVLTQSAVGLLP